jgi:hypothetical protein
MAQSKSAASATESAASTAANAAAASPRASTPSAAREEALADGVREIATAWARYAEAVMRHTSEASRALLRCQSFGEMIEVQAQLLQGNLRAFLDQSTKVANIAARFSSRSFEASKSGSGHNRS